MKEHVTATMPFTINLDRGNTMTLNKKYLKCPEGYIFGKDNDEIDDCDICEIFEECLDEYKSQYTPKKEAPKPPEPQINDFSKAQIGQELYSLRKGPVTVENISSDGVISCQTPSKIMFSWGKDGEYRLGPRIFRQDLFWRKPNIEFQPDPKTKVKKVATVFVNIYPNSNVYAHMSVEQALEYKGDDAHIVAQKVEIPYEVEE